MSQPLLFIIGTRPEGIKLIPLFKLLKSRGLNVLLCATSQHREMLAEVCTVFKVTPDFDLNIMKESQDLFYVTQIILEKLQALFKQIKPGLVFVHGDTTTTFAAALSAFYYNIPIAHVEAGLRTGNIRHPFPEEMNRKAVAQLATFHFAPTPFATAHLLNEGINRQNIFCTGNTVVDALQQVQKEIAERPELVDPGLRTLITEAKKKNKKLFLVTAHRKESYGQGLINIFSALSTFAQESVETTLLIHPVHPHPEVQKALNATDFHQQKNVLKIPPLSYSNMVYLLQHIDVIATDSGGLQEEGTALGKPVLCLREVTERWEGVWDGLEILVGTDPAKIIPACHQMLTATAHQPSTLYGDGTASEKIATILATRLSELFQKNENMTYSFKDSLFKEKNI
jgi:UDP-N-acetylglucosamine 2-epimerase (non-hydrolysing)